MRILVPPGFYHFYRRIYTIIIKSHPVDEGPVLRQTEQPGFVIAGLGNRGNRSYLYKTKTQGIQFTEVMSIFIEART